MPLKSSQLCAAADKQNTVTFTSRLVVTLRSKAIKNKLHLNCISLPAVLTQNVNFLAQKRCIASNGSNFDLGVRLSGAINQCLYLEIQSEPPPQTYHPGNHGQSTWYCNILGQQTRPTHTLTEPFTFAVKMRMYLNNSIQ
ncbi:hypothetical protein CBL_05377 [Carabus blaptoides fortunei]